MANSGRQITSFSVLPEPSVTDVAGVLVADTPDADSALVTVGAAVEVAAFVSVELVDDCA